MNKVKGIVDKVLNIRQSKHNGKWFVRVKYKSWGNEAVQTLIFDDEETARNIRKGHEFLT